MDVSHDACVPPPFLPVPGFLLLRPPQIEKSIVDKDMLDHDMSVQKLADLKAKSPTDLLAFAEELEVENASSMRKQDMLFAILKELADRDVEIIGIGVLEVLQDGFGFLRSPQAHYPPGPVGVCLGPTPLPRSPPTPAPAAGCVN